VHNRCVCNADCVQQGAWRRVHEQVLKQHGGNLSAGEGQVKFSVTWHSTKRYLKAIEGTYKGGQGQGGG
jgi:hypothetical protein